MVVNVSSLSVNEPRGATSKDTEASVPVGQGYSVSLPLLAKVWRTFSVGCNKVRSGFSSIFILPIVCAVLGWNPALPLLGSVLPLPQPNLRV